MLQRCARACVALILVALCGSTVAQTTLGGFQRQEDAANDAAVQDAAQFAVSEIDEGVQLLRVLSAQKQVVAGLVFKLQLDTSGGIFDATVYKGLGDAPHQLTSYHKMTDSGVLGGSKALSVQDPEVQHAAEAAVQQMSSRSNSLFPMKLEEVVKASSKVHGQGTEYRIRIRVAQQSLQDTTVEADITRGLDNGQYKLGDVVRVGPPSQ